MSAKSGRRPVADRLAILDEHFNYNKQNKWKNARINRACILYKNVLTVDAGRREQQRQHRRHHDAGVVEGISHGEHARAHVASQQVQKRIAPPDAHNLC